MHGNAALCHLQSPLTNGVNRQSLVCSEKWNILGRGKYTRHCGYSRHQTQLAPRSDTFPFLDVINGNGSLAARSIFRSVPVWVLNCGIYNEYLHKLLKYLRKSPPLWSITFVTTIIVSTSPFLKDRSCSDVPLKLYLATHSVPCGHVAFGKTDRTQMSRNIFLLIGSIDLWPVFAWMFVRRRYFTDLDICHGGVFQSCYRSRFLTAIIRAGKRTPAGDAKHDRISIFALSQTGSQWMCGLAVQRPCKFIVG